MAQNFRHSEILTIARDAGKVTVEGLAAHFNVTAQTIRRDLGELCDIGQLTRVHGGAMIPSGVIALGYEDRRSLASLEKDAIARLVAAADPRRRLDLHEHRHHHRGRRAGAARSTAT